MCHVSYWLHMNHLYQGIFTLTLDSAWLHRFPNNYSTSTHVYKKYSSELKFTINIRVSSHVPQVSWCTRSFLFACTISILSTHIPQVHSSTGMCLWNLQVFACANGSSMFSLSQVLSCTYKWQSYSHMSQVLSNARMCHRSPNVHKCTTGIQ